jgi:hypothetical protein
MRLATGLVIVGVACAVAGCGGSEADHVRATVQQLMSAMKSKDYGAICDHVLAPSLVQRLAASGVSCEYVMQLALGPDQNRMISIGKVNVRGDNAEAITLMTAKGQQSSVNAIRLIKTPDGWRVTSLNAPLIAK